MSKYLIQAHEKIYLSMTAEAALEAGIQPESKHHPHVEIGPLSLGGAHACQDDSSSAADKGVLLLVHGIVAVGGDFSVYPLPITAQWPDLTGADELETRKQFVSGLMWQDANRIAEHLQHSMSLTGEQEGN